MLRGSFRCSTPFSEAAHAAQTRRTREREAAEAGFELEKRFQKRLKVTRGHTAGPLPGKSLAVLDADRKTEFLPVDAALQGVAGMVARDGLWLMLGAVAVGGALWLSTPMIL